MSTQKNNAAPLYITKKSLTEILSGIDEQGQPYSGASVNGQAVSLPHYIYEKTPEGQAKIREQTKEFEKIIKTTASEVEFSMPSKVEQNFSIFMLSLVGIVFVTFFVFAVFCKSNKTIKNKTTTLNNDKDSFSKEEIEKKEQEKKRLKEYLQDLEIQELHNRIKDLESKLNQKN